MKKRLLYPPMTCPVCESLNREHSRECEIEAAAVIRQRFELFRKFRGDGSGTDQNHVEVVLASRKRQLQITSQLQRHKAAAHAA
jgi:hypothetical protein